MEISEKDCLYVCAEHALKLAETCCDFIRRLSRVMMCEGYTPSTVPINISLYTEFLLVDELTASLIPAPFALSTDKRGLKEIGGLSGISSRCLVKYVPCTVFSSYITRKCARMCFYFYGFPYCLTSEGQPM